MRVVALVDAQGVAHRLADRRDGQTAFFRRVDHFDVQPGGHEDAVEERFAVARPRAPRWWPRRGFLDLVQIEGFR